MNYLFSPYSSEIVRKALLPGRTLAFFDWNAHACRYYTFTQMFQMWGRSVCCPGCKKLARDMLNKKIANVSLFSVHNLVFNLSIVIYLFTKFLFLFLAVIVTFNDVSGFESSPHRIMKLHVDWYPRGAEADVEGNSLHSNQHGKRNPTYA